MKALRTIFRILVGLVFIFSGFVKGVDPIGTVYRMNDYFIAFGADWAQPLSPYLTIFMVTLEFTIGISLVFNLWIKGMAWILLPVMTYFTILTLFDALYNLVPDCGCFGDAVKLSNVNTFIKNLVLMGFVIPIFMWRKQYKPLVSKKVQILVIVLFALAFGGMSVYAYRHLPLIDFMGWKKGNNVNKTSTTPVKFYVTYKNTRTGETKEYLAPNYPWNDSVWMSQWVFVSQRAAEETVLDAMTLHIEDEVGNDMTSTFLGLNEPHFIAVAYDLPGTNETGFKKLNMLYQTLAEEGYSFILLTSTLPEEAHLFTAKRNTDIPIFYADDAVLKTMVRSNPGLILLNNGVVVEKWAWRDLPKYDELVSNYVKAK